MSIRFDHVRLKFEPRDMWVGLYWKRGRPVSNMVPCGKATVGHGRPYRWYRFRVYHFYLCLLPMLPIIVQFHTKRLEER